MLGVFFLFYFFFLDYLGLMVRFLWFLVIFFIIRLYWWFGNMYMNLILFRVSCNMVDYIDGILLGEEDL